MKRRKFFHITSVSVAGLGLAASCSNGKTPADTKRGGGQVIKEIPGYRKNVNSELPKDNQKSANDTVVLALIGAGAHGINLTLQAAKLNENIRFKYICDVDDTRGGLAISELKKMQGFEPVRTRDMRKVFDDKEIDGVIIATPGQWHALATVWACQAGKDVYVEKAISLSIHEGQQMALAAQKYGRVVQCGTQNRSAEYAFSARDYIKNGGLGDITAVHVRGLLNGPVPFNEKEDSAAPETIDWDMWLGPAPKVPYNLSRNKSWYYYWDYGVGLAMEDMSHQVDLARLVLGNPGLPKSVYCAGGRYFFNDNRETPDYQMATCDFGDYVMTLQAGECAPYMEKSGPGVRFTENFPEWGQNATRIEILGTKRMMYIGRMGGGWQVQDKGGEIVAQEPGLYSLAPHLKNYIDCIRTREQANGGIAEGHKSSVLIHLANLSYRAGNKQILFSPEYEAVLNDSKVQELAGRGYRKGFELPEV
ncbi:gfo/Idh/MocA family oxidoreductase [Mariniphaga sediminis]|uniref:Gfo/Idh/MocA family oxidoreductase n=1 Tax=Mariniphaga sediminis TaxID=1628158 RepID=A0A399CTT6_9BACT|nr:Gfo/Idh/MocA family oxidoreductase [Mariniphaga sediminis]RIH62803.1 gfo/Idh/MocA family oxidoreductase [Mariniphaga sediminis]